MNQEIYVELLGRHGDTMEKYIVEQTSQDREAFGLIYPYSRIWARFVFHHRLPEHPDMTEDKWLEFSTHHYTAMLRAFMVRNVARQLDDTCMSYLECYGHNDIGCYLIRAHELISAFWMNIGSSVETLLKAVKNIPEEVRDGANLKITDYPDLKQWSLYRNQFIHYPLVPLVPGATGTLLFKEEMIDGISTNWKKDVEYGCLSKYYLEQADLFLGKMKEAWGDLERVFSNRAIREGKEQLDFEKLLTTQTVCPPSGAGMRYVPPPQPQSGNSAKDSYVTLNVTLKEDGK